MGLGPHDRHDAGLLGPADLGIVALFRHSDGKRQERPDSERLLAQRFAAGEIHEQDYHRRLQTLRPTNRQPTGLRR